MEKGRTDRSRVIHIAEAQKRIPGPAGENAVVVLQHGTLDVKLSFPLRPNLQTPHAQDEVYIVVRGVGVLVHEEVREAFAPGDLVFVPAGIDHRFEETSDDFAVWRIFYGPDGGEVV